MIIYDLGAEVKDIDMIYFLRIKWLRVNQIIEEARKHAYIDHYMPDLRILKRDYVINVSKIQILIFLKQIH